MLELKNTSQHLLRGLEAEHRIRDFLLSKGYLLRGERFKTPFAEVDLLFIKNNRIYIVEVKTLPSVEYLATRISAKQKLRLRNAVVHLTDKHQREVVLLWAFVLSSGEVMFIREGFD